MADGFPSDTDDVLHDGIRNQDFIFSSWKDVSQSVRAKITEKSKSDNVICAKRGYPLYGAQY